MEVKYDPKAQAAYIRLTDAAPYFGIISYTQELTDNVLVDWMADGTLYGIDISGLESKPIVRSLTEGEKCMTEEEEVDFLRQYRESKKGIDEDTARLLYKERLEIIKKIKANLEAMPKRCNLT